MTAGVTVWFPHDRDRRAIDVQIRNEPDTYYRGVAAPEAQDHDETIMVPIVVQKTILLVGNQNGFAYLAEVVTELLLSGQPGPVDITEGEGLLPGSPRLIFQFDPTLDRGRE